ncbi:MAG: putative DNA binding domain-containing protein [Candidatus Pseudobacter hemicellulosilyticus]|uniref:DNA binding domain-containing protein n=1 Tax=Candidatus Pseudobacter hemicellulosilyticus TaxID=3121375 RepID=A0AAJ5WVL3_9BACT|nr:MAG: putative DNA binding domain-containing protein [Pseudobacter sp.]
MTTEELRELIEQGEGQQLEFKQSIPSKASELSRELCAFANAKGGRILVGVDDKGKIVGVTLNNTIRSEIQQIVRLLDPKVEVRISEIQSSDKTILCLECEAGPKKPYAASGSIYVRNGPNSEKLTSTEEMHDFWQESGRIFFDKMKCKEYKYPEHFDSEIFKAFIRKAKITGSIGEKKVLENLQLVVDDKFTYAAVMMFAKNVQYYAFHATIRCVLFKGTNKRFILDSKEMVGNLIHQFEEALKYLIAKLNLRYDIEGQPGGRRKEVLEIPETVFREALINAVCHRSYYAQGASTMVEIYDNRVEISNPGGLIGVIPQKDFGHMSFSRNPLVFGLMQRIDLVEKVGSGIGRMRDGMKDAQLPAPVFKMTGFFTVIFYRPVAFTVWIASIKDKLGEKQCAILQQLNDFPDSTIKLMADALHTTTRTIERNITVLKQLGLLQRIGSAKEGHYQINKIPLLLE